LTEKSINVVETRQRADRLWESAVALAVSGTFSGAPRRTAGYGRLNVFISSNLSFRLRIEEACSESGPWTETHRATSAANDAGTAQVVTDPFTPSAEFARIFVDNLGVSPQTTFTLCVSGLPQSGTGGAGADGEPSILWSFPGTTSIDQNANIPRWKARDGARTFTKFDANLVGAPTGQSWICEFHKLDAAGVVDTLLATVTILAGQRYGEAVVTASLAADEEIFPLVTQVGLIAIGTTALMRARP
jgi:hypothetical protein